MGAYPIARSGFDTTQCVGQILVEEPTIAIHRLFDSGPGFCGGGVVSEIVYFPGEARRIPRSVLPRLFWRGFDGVASARTDIRVWIERNSKSN